MSNSLFCYGTLRSPAVLQTVLGMDLVGEQAYLADYAAFRVKEAMYPGIVPQQGARVEGLVYHGVFSELLKELDIYEGPHYARLNLPVNLGNGKTCEAGVYVTRNEWLCELSSEPWSYDAFVNQGLLVKYLQYLSA